jgi:hypothetical protein
MCSYALMAEMLQQYNGVEGAGIVLYCSAAVWLAVEECPLSMFSFSWLL